MVIRGSAPGLKAERAGYREEQRARGAWGLGGAWEGVGGWGWGVGGGRVPYWL